MRDKPVDEHRMPIGDHLEDLRRRLILGFVGALVPAVVLLMFGRDIIQFLCRPLLQVLADAGLPAQLHVTRVTTPFAVYLKVSIFGGLILGAPWLIYQLWKFVETGLYSTERRIVIILAPFSAVMVVLGLGFTYFIMLPICLAFFVHFMQGYPQPTPNGGVSMLHPIFEIGEYISFVTLLALGIAAAFQLPVAMLIIGWSGVVDPAFVARYRRHCVFGCFVLGAALTPVDLISMVVLAIPLYGLFEFGLMLMRAAYRRAPAGQSG
jgi:sec-independent protein translocase protein TatC